MGVFTELEKRVMKLLFEGKRTSEIAKTLNLTPTSVSRALKNIRIKAIDIEADLEFMLEIEYLQIKGNKIKFITKDKNPKAIGKRRL